MYLWYSPSLINEILLSEMKWLETVWNEVLFVFMMLQVGSSFRFGKNVVRIASVFRPSLLSMATRASSTTSSMEGVETKRDVVYKERLDSLRDKMKEMNISVFVVPTDDPHMSEYTAEYYNRREFVSGFTGSAGVAVVTMDEAFLFTDGRYHQQADIELPKSWTSMKIGVKSMGNWAGFLITDKFKTETIGLDPFLHPAEVVNKLQSAVGKDRVRLLQENPIDLIWTENRPMKPSTPVRIHPLEYAGKDVPEKLEELRQKMQKQSTNSFVVSSLDEIMWLFNIRGSDVLCNPVSISYAVITLDQAYLFIDSNKVDETVRFYLESRGVTLRPYEDILPFLNAHSETFTAENQPSKSPPIWIDTKNANAAIVSAIPAALRYESNSPIVLMKALKNEAELQGMRACHLRDGAAFVEFISWLEEELVVKDNTSITEVDIDVHLTASRASYGKFLEPSFPTIAGVNSNGAIVHYRADSSTCKTVTKHDMLLLDSGGQYEDGTTDVTRTFHFGEPSAHQKNMYTRVLKGHMAIDRLVFPAGTPGYLLDSHARVALWAAGKDYNHGTGHGVGAALNVHERPQSLSPSSLNTQAFLPSMIISNEPGYYEANNFGIRIENLLIVTPQPALGNFGEKSFYGFEKLTHIPIQTRCIDLSLLTAEEVSWLNTYHQQVREKIMPLLRTKRAQQWLQTATKPLFL